MTVRLMRKLDKKHPHGTRVVLTPYLAQRALIEQRSMRNLKIGAWDVKTVDSHRGHVLLKLSCRNAVGLTRLLIRAGIIRVDAAVRAA